ncbi:hypothetical protein IFR04_014913 [Cadophora malorum]|uniref:Uncharacterized protein n=1 Tax=Cadophora malorum TaxID=108018 RepID=A0A8H7T1V5_9HELO|nr:hypothetical protein IFR04_014913 [Cadophora malorum]
MEAAKDWARLACLENIVNYVIAMDDWTLSPPFFSTNTEMVFSFLVHLGWKILSTPGLGGDGYIPSRLASHASTAPGFHADLPASSYTISYISDFFLSFTPKSSIMTSPSKTPEHANSPATPIPTPSATPSEVQIYFTSLLSTLHSVPANEAQEIALKWKLGRGQEMSSFSVDTYRQIFGWEAGTVLYGHVNGTKANKRSGTKLQPTEKDRPKTDIFGLEPGCESPFQVSIPVFASEKLNTQGGVKTDAN